MNATLTKRTRRQTRALLAAVALGLGSASNAGDAERVQPFSVKYEIARSLAKGEVEQTLRQGADSNEFIYDSRLRGKGIVAVVFPQTPTQTSRFRLTEQGIQPIEFTLDDGTRRAEHDGAIAFDWKTKKAQTHYGSKAAELDIEVGTLDPLTVYVAVMQDLGRGVDSPHYTVVERSDLRRYAFHRQAEEEVDTPAGTFTTVKYRLERSRSKSITYNWFAPELNFLPVRVEQWRNGKLKTTMQLTSVEGL